jgi:hypothetical protein
MIETRNASRIDRVLFVFRLLQRNRIKANTTLVPCENTRLVRSQGDCSIFMTPPDLSHHPELPQEIIDAAEDGKLVLFVGAGISKICELPNWAELADKVVSRLVDQDAIDYWEQEQLRVLDPRTKLSIASIICKQKKLEFDLGSLLQPSPKSKSSIYSVLNAMGCPCITTNYDELLRPVPPIFGTTVSTPGPSKTTHRVHKASDIHSGLLGDPGTVIHLHGFVGDPEGMVVTTGDYLGLYDRHNIQEFLKRLFEQKTVLFLGYGLSEAEILEYILRRARVEKEDVRKRFVLQGFFARHDGLYRNLYSYYKESFGVHVLGFIRDKKDYAQQEEILSSWASKIHVKATTLADDIQFMEDVLNED